jgi:hypothetical protein
MASARQSGSDDLSSKAQDLLWRDLRDLFEDETSIHAGPGVGFDGLTGPEVLRVWDFLSSRATSIGEEPTISNRDNEEVSEPPSLADAVALLTQGEREIGYLKVIIESVQTGGVLLPWLAVESGLMRSPCTGGLRLESVMPKGWLRLPRCWARFGTWCLTRSLSTNTAVLMCSGHP